MSLEKIKLTTAAPRRSPIGLRVVAIFILLLAGTYAIAVIAGLLPKERRIDAATLGIIGIATLAATVLFRPDIFDRVTRLEVAGWKLEIEKRQEKQDEQLTDIRLILPILLPEAERKHLLNLADEKTKNYEGSHALRSELRRLRSIQLIKMRPGRMVGGIVSDQTVDLSDFVELTELGQRWVERLKEIESDANQAQATLKSQV